MSEWKPTLYTPLRVQEHHSQVSLFASPEPRTEERPPCDHVGTAREDQTRLDGGRDVICGNCGAVLESGDPPPANPSPRRRTVREFSKGGPCIPLGDLIRETEHFYVYLRDPGGIEARIAKRTLGGHYSPAHAEPCTRCTDHPQTSYPNQRG